MHPRSLLTPVAASLAPFLPPLLAIVLTQTQAIIASVIVILVVLLAWKFLKLAFKIALVVGAAVAIYFALKWAGIL